MGRGEKKEDSLSFTTMHVHHYLPTPTSTYVRMYGRLVSTATLPPNKKWDILKNAFLSGAM